MRRRVLLYLTLIALSACNGDKVTAPTDAATDPSKVIVDGNHCVISGTTCTIGNPDFFFLPPMVQDPSSSPNWDTGAFNPDLEPVVKICASRALTVDQIPTAACDADPDRIAVVDPSAEQYKLNWQVPTSATIYYRLAVTVGTTTLGYADLETGSNTGQLKKVGTNEVIQLLDGRTLPIKFRIERYALCEVPGVGPCATKAIDVFGAGGKVSLPLVPNSTKDNGVIFASSTASTAGLATTTTTTGKRTITVERCTDFRQREVTDLPTFGPCVRLRVEPALTSPLTTPALVYSCDVTAASVTGTVSHAQAERITMHRLVGDKLEALPHDHPDCGLSTAATGSMRGMLSDLAHGRLRSAGRQMVAMLAPKSLYAARFIDLGGGGLTSLDAGGGALSVSSTGGPRLSVSGVGQPRHEFQFLLPAKFDFIETATDRAAYPADQLSVSVKVTDLGDEPVMNARVRFSVDQGGTVSDAIKSTGSDGCSARIATVAWTVTAPSPNTLTATGKGIGGEDSHGPRNRTPTKIDPFQPCDRNWEVPGSPLTCAETHTPTTVGVGTMKVTAITVGSIDGHVIDAQTGDAIDATVTWSPFGPAAPTSASGGAFRIENLTPGPRLARQQYSLSFTSSKHQDRARAGIDVQPKETTHLGDVCLTPSNGSISGTVVSTLDGKLIDPDAVTVTATQTTVPFSDKCVAAGDAAPAPASVTVPGSHGAFAIAGLPPGTYSLSVHSDDYDDATVAGVVVKAAEETANPAIPLKWKFGNITGTVVKSLDGSPLGGVTLSDGTNTATSTADGSFLLRRLVPGAHTVTYSAVGYAGASRDATVTASQSTALAAVRLDPTPASASATVSPESFTGACPKQFVFTATISAAPGTAISYVWDRSDGATMTALTVTTDATGSATVQTTWDLSPASFSGWEQLRMTLADGTVVRSNQANFTLSCTAS
ncbi:MAG: hypothetical protein HOQ30_13920 [Gemmatimonadaceae bacterium]|nr:hypothetical protein [Gemmatimonadaceae bacterium]